MSTIGVGYRVSTAGESHGKAITCLVQGLPSCLRLTEDDIQPQLTRRRPGQSNITTPRNEKDRVQILNGTNEYGVTYGSPISMIVHNEDQRPKDYGNKTMDQFPRPSHADYTYQQKYGIRATSGGGRSSARETIGRVCAGAAAEKCLKECYGVEIVAFTSAIGHVKLFPDTKEYPCAAANPAFNTLIDNIDRKTVDEFVPTRCPDNSAAKEMEDLILQCKEENDSIGGQVTCVIRNVPTSLGEPCFDKLEAALAQAMLSIPATKSFEIGSGIGGTTMRGSRHNDPFVPKAEAKKPVPQVVQESGAYLTGAPEVNGPLTTTTNFSGGIQGGISNGNHIYFTVGFKAAATIGQDQLTATYDGSSQGILAAKGRHDPSVVPRAVPIVEAMAAIVIMDMACRWIGPSRLRDLLLAHYEAEDAKQPADGDVAA